MSDLERERAAFHSTLTQVGPDAPTTCGDWTTGQLAVHVVVGELNGGLATVPFRYLVHRGIRLDRMAGFNTRVVDRYDRRRTFEWAMTRLDRKAPRAHVTGPIAAVSILEVWAHHEDALAANDIGQCTSGIDLGPVLRVLVRYQRRLLAEHAVAITGWHDRLDARVTVDGPPAVLARWLAGRGGWGDLDATGDAAAVAALAGDTPHI